MEGRKRPLVAAPRSSRLSAFYARGALLSNKRLFRFDRISIGNEVQAGSLGLSAAGPERCIAAHVRDRGFQIGESLLQGGQYGVVGLARRRSQSVELRD